MLSFLDHLVCSVPMICMIIGDVQHLGHVSSTRVNFNRLFSPHFNLQLA